MLNAKNMIESLINNGYEISIQPEKRTSEWLGVDAVLFSVAVWKDGKRICGSIHRLLTEAMMEVFETTMPADGE
jgi:hypothetical protein